MSFCPKCGTQLPEEDAKFCPACGAPLEEKKAQPAVAAKSDTNEKALCIISYIGPLVFIPLFTANDNENIIFHAKQGFTLFLLEVALLIVSCIPIIGSIIGFIGEIFTLVLTIVGIIHVCRNESTALPVIGGIDAWSWFKK